MASRYFVRVARSASVGGAEAEGAAGREEARLAAGALAARLAAGLAAGLAARLAAGGLGGLAAGGEVALLAAVSRAEGPRRQALASRAGARSRTRGRARMTWFKGKRREKG
jgi:hypothetical protein